MNEPICVTEERALRAALATIEVRRAAERPRPRRAIAARSPAERARPSSLIDVDLAPAQRDAIARPEDRSLLVIGEAGHGKTTVALHRLAHLWKLARDRRTPIRAAVIVPTTGLARLLQPLLAKLGVDVSVTTYDRWAARQARRAFPDLPRRESEDAATAIAHVKRDPALRLAIDRIAAKDAGRIDDDFDAVTLRSRAHARRADLQHLFGDREILKEVASASQQTIDERAIDRVLEHSRIQFEKTTEQAFSHVTDRERLVAVDRRALDDGTASNDAGTVDVEDYAVMFEVDRVRATRRGREPTRPRAYDVILLDEAQEFAPLELALIGRSAAPNGTLIVAGDAEQQIDPSVTFTSWDDTMRALGCVEHDTVTLDVGYRCPPGVVALAGAVIGRGPAASRASGVDCAAFEDDVTLAAWLVDEIRSAARRDRSATIGVICRSSITARRLARWLRIEVPARLVFDGRFWARGGVQVTTVDQVRGLELDTVVIPDANAATYVDDAASRRALYVAITRARSALVVAHAGPRTPILAAY